ncbi:MAG: VTT domain-containing protein [Natronomonas sp.]
MVSEAIVETTLGVVIAVGVPVLVALFLSEGLVVGKILQPPAVFIGYVVVASPGRFRLVVLCAGCVAAAVLGQWALYRSFNDQAPELFGLRRRVPGIASLPDRVTERVGKRRLSVVENLFDRYGAVGVCLSNAVPVIRSLMAVPAGLSRYPVGRFLAATTVGNVIYILLLVGVARGVVGLAGLFG